jgi:hypothetical protein
MKVLFLTHNLWIRHCAQFGNRFAILRPRKDVPWMMVRLPLLCLLIYSLLPYVDYQKKCLDKEIYYVVIAIPIPEKVLEGLLEGNT